jgi:hypothetical protein
MVLVEKKEKTCPNKKNSRNQVHYNYGYFRREKKELLPRMASSLGVNLPCSKWNSKLNILGK